jgi:hypothetical protein
MRQFQTHVLDFKFAYESSFATEPFECGWASEAIFFVRIEEIAGTDTAVTLYADISVDGVHWTAEGATLGPLARTGDYFFRVRHFGGFIRMRGEVAGTAPRIQFTNNLVLKE